MKPHDIKEDKHLWVKTKRCVVCDYKRLQKVIRKNAVLYVCPNCWYSTLKIKNKTE